ICCPMRSVIFGPARRVMMSMVLPGGKGMTILIGLAGYDWASAAEANPRASVAKTNTRSCLILALLTRFRRFIILRAVVTTVIPERAGIQRPEAPESPTKTNAGTSGESAAAL